MKMPYKLQNITICNDYVALFTAETETRVWFMGDGVVRVRTSFDGAFDEESLSLVWTAWDDLYDDLLSDERIRTVPVIPTIQEDDNKVWMTDGEILLNVGRNPFSLAFYVHGRLQFRDVAGRGYTYHKGRVRYSFQLDNGNYYGFGEKTGALEKTGTYMRIANKDACGYDPVCTDPLYKHVPYFIKLDENSDACGVFFNLSADCAFDIGREYNGYWPRMGQFEAELAEIDLFFIAGPAMSDVVRRFTKLTGRPAMLPLRALGYIGSTMYYSELAAHCDDAILKFVKKAKAEGIPCSDFHLSSGYTTDTDGKRNVFTWNYDKFPDPLAFIRRMKEEDVTVTPNIKPGILCTHPEYSQLAVAGAFIQHADGTPYIIRFWGGDGSLLDFSNPSVRSLWAKKIIDNLTCYGITSVWNDNNEFDVSGCNAFCNNEGRPVLAENVRARLPMLMTIASKKALETAAPEMRLYQVTRSGNAGINRYAQTWTGDNCTSWASLKHNIATVLGAGISGMANTGSDVGGFIGEIPSPELFIRWIWYGVLQPRFSIHSANNDNTVTEPWMYPHLLPIIRKAYKLRMMLMPYLYSLMYEAHCTGAPIMRPMIYEFQEDFACRHQGIDFMLGRALLAACVVEPGETKRSVYLPKCEGFYDFVTREYYTGGQTVILNADIESTPLLQRKGSILPLEKDDGITIVVCPGESPCKFTLYEDDGWSNSYLNGNYRSTTFTVAGFETKVEISVETTGNFKTGKQLQFEVQCDGRAPYEIYWNGDVIEQFLTEEDFIMADSGWYYRHSERICQVKNGDGRTLKTMTVDFSYFDLFRMRHR
jgi:alpha-glucosidase